jgi:hypothetical protein
LGYDFAYVEISTDEGNSWSSIAKFNGSQNWSSFKYSLKNFLSNSKTFQIRFKITSDATTSMDGWYISDINILK